MKKPTLTLVALTFALLSSCASSPQYFPGANPELPYSSLVRVGNTVYVAGHLGLDPDTGKAPASVEQEITIMLDRFSATLARAGLTMDNLVRVDVYCSNVTLYPTFNDLYGKRFTKKRYPTRAFVGSGTLLRGCHFEIVGIAVD